MKKLTFLTIVLFFAALQAEAQFIKTSLTITVRDELGNTADSVAVKIYENEADYNAEKNPAAQGMTDAKGVVKFKEIKAISYYVLARKGNKDNAGGGERIGKLEEKKINKVTIIIQ
jgi:uncharacterized protein (DUF2141 family)